jgi:hypothetical protein
MSAREQIPCPHCGRRAGWRVWCWHQCLMYGWTEHGDHFPLNKAPARIVESERSVRCHSIDVCRACGEAVS